MGSGRKCDVSSHHFLIEAFTLHAKYFSPPYVSFPLAHSPYFLYLHMHSHMESISRSERRRTTISPSSVLHSAMCVKKPSNIERTDQTHLASLSDTHSPRPLWQVCSPGRTGVPLLLRLCPIGDPGCCPINVWAK